MHRWKSIVCAAGILVLSAQVAGAAVVEYTDRPTWTTAIGGAADFAEDFSGFAADAPFSPAPTTVDLAAGAMGTIGEINTALAFRNTVDVPPLTFTDNNGTSHASCFVNAPEGADPGTQIEIVFAEPMSAWGADFVGTAGAELLAIDVIEAGTGTILATLGGPPPAQDLFLGFVADAGEQIGSVVLRPTNLIGGGTGRGFGMDDLASVAAGPPVSVLDIPTLSEISLVALALLLGGMAIVVLRRRA